MPWPIEAICAAAAAYCPNLSVQVLPSVDSSNSELMRRVRAGGLTAPTLLVAQEQTAGRGRQGRTWHSSAGASLTFSLSYPLGKLDCSGLSLAVGVSLAERLAPANSALRLKWPNDLWLHGRKLGGILVETASNGGQRQAVVGVGLNICSCEQVAANKNLQPAFLDELQAGVTAQLTLLQVVPALLQVLQEFAQAGFAPLQDRFAARDALVGRKVEVSDGTRGVACGVDVNGALRVQTAAGVQTIIDGEVSVRACQELGQQAAAKSDA